MQDFQAELQSHIGIQSSPQLARDPVNQPMIRHWCDAMHDHNPVYTDPEFAARSIHGAIVAPPPMLNAWNMLGNIPRRSGAGDAQGLLAQLDRAGYTSVVATNCDHEYPRYLRLGESLHGSSCMSEVSEEKQTALGCGHFVTLTTEYRNQSDEVVGRMLFRLLKFKPGTGSSAPAGAVGPREAAHSTAPQDPEPAPPERPSPDTLRIDQVEVGEALPPCPIPITTLLIVAGAIASRDYQDVHHDRELALKRGSPDIFMNILTTTGLCGRYISDWAGPEALMRSLSIRLGAPNSPHDTMTMSGSILSKTATDAGGLIEVSLQGANRLGNHVTGSVTLQLLS